MEAKIYQCANQTQDKVFDWGKTVSIKAIWEDRTHRISKFLHDLVSGAPTFLLNR